VITLSIKERLERRAYEDVVSILRGGLSDRVCFRDCAWL
jgi:hypothetical protein